MAPPQPGPAVLPRHSMDQSPESGVGTRPSSSAPGVLLTKLILRALTSVLMFISLLVLTTNTVSDTTIDGKETTHKFSEVMISYRYLLFTILLGLLYSLLQTALTIFQLINGKRISNFIVYLDLYGDLVLLYALATGAGAGFAAAIDAQDTFKAHTGGSNFFDKFFEKGNAATSLVLLGSVCSAVSLVLSAFGLDGRP